MIMKLEETTSAYRTLRSLVHKAAWLVRVRFFVSTRLIELTRFSGSSLTLKKNGEKNRINQRKMIEFQANFRANFRLRYRQFCVKKALKARIALKLSDESLQKKHSKSFVYDSIFGALAIYRCLQSGEAFRKVFSKGTLQSSESEIPCLNCYLEQYSMNTVTVVHFIGLIAIR